MNHQIDGEILKKAAKCIFKYRCLDTAPGCFCKVKNYLPTGAGSFLFELFGKINCPYCASFAKEAFCTCPVREAFYLDYSV